MANVLQKNWQDLIKPQKLQIEQNMKELQVLIPSMQMMQQEEHT